MKQISYNDFNELLTKEEICFINSFDEAVIRTEIVDGTIVYYVKLKGEEEFKAEQGSNIVAGGWQEHTLISRAEYDAY